MQTCLSFPRKKYFTKKTVLALLCLIAGQFTYSSIREISQSTKKISKSSLKNYTQSKKAVPLKKYNQPTKSRMIIKEMALFFLPSKLIVEKFFSSHKFSSCNSIELPCDYTVDSKRKVKRTWDKTYDELKVLFNLFDQAYFHFKQQYNCILPPPYFGHDIKNSLARLVSQKSALDSYECLLKSHLKRIECYSNYFQKDPCKGPLSNKIPRLYKTLATKFDTAIHSVGQLKSIIKKLSEAEEKSHNSLDIKIKQPRREAKKSKNSFYMTFENTEVLIDPRDYHASFQRILDAGKK